MSACAESEVPPTRVNDEEVTEPMRGHDDVPVTLIGGRYATREAIGRGGMATVFEATDLATGDRVAVKRPRVVLDAHDAGLILAEARAMARVAHPNIATVRDAGIDPVGPWFVMERLDGESLHEFIEREGALSPAVVGGILLPLLDGVGAVHRCGLAHGDIKPSNVILARRGSALTPMLIDFGVAARIEAHDYSEELLGTPTYMSPERFVLRAPPDVASDLWSLGALLFTCLAGEAPYHGARVADVVYDVLTRTPTPPPAVSRALVAIIERAMARSPGERFRSTEEMSLALREALRAEVQATPAAPAQCAAG